MAMDLEPTPARIEEYRRLVAEVLDDSVRDMSHMLFDKEDAQHSCLATIYATIIQSARDCMIVLSQPSVTAVGGMLRSIVESYADLCATINDKDYVKRLIATFYQEKLRLMRNMRRAPTNAFHEDLAKHFDTDAEQVKVSAELAALGVEPLKIHERFAAGGLQEIYESLYWQLCLQGHNNVSALQGRHIRGTSDEYQIVLFQNNRPSELAMYFDVLSAVLTDCAIRVHGFLDTKVLPRYEKRVLALRAFRDAVHAEVTTPPAGTT
jgi:hypothetical protein